jgi:chitodextrinase
MRWINSFVGARSRAALAVVGLVGAAVPALAADTVAPTTPDSFTNTAVTVTSASFTWTAATDNVAVTACLVERCTGVGCVNFAQVVSTAALSYTNAGLAVQGTYNYRIRARDAANNKSAYSPAITVGGCWDTHPSHGAA